MRTDDAYDVWSLILRNPVLNKADLARIALVSRTINLAATNALYDTLWINFGVDNESPVPWMQRFLNSPNKLVPACRRWFMLVEDSKRYPTKPEMDLVKQICQKSSFHTFQVLQIHFAEAPLKPWTVDRRAHSRTFWTFEGSLRHLAAKRNRQARFHGLRRFVGHAPSRLGRLELIDFAQCVYLSPA
jgi:hypothetical protein